MISKDKQIIENIVKSVFRYNLEEIKFKDNKLTLSVEGKAYGDGYSSYVYARYKNGERVEMSFDGNPDKSSIDLLEKKLGVENLKKLDGIALSECYD